MFIIPLVWVLFGIGAVLAAANKGRSGCAWFALGLFLGPFGLLFALLVPKIEPPVPPPLAGGDPRQFIEEETKICPQCAETIKFAAKKCRHCGAAFDPEEVDRQVAARRADLEEHLRAGKKICPRCGTRDILPQATLPNGGLGPWCPHCRRPL